MSSLQNLAFVASRAARLPGFLARTFAVYRELEHLAEDELRAMLGCSISDFIRLALCKVSPQPTASELRELAEFGGADLRTLAGIIRRVNAVETFQGAASAATHAFLLAASEREDDIQKSQDDDTPGC